jgi:hypothetical protein
MFDFPNTPLNGQTVSGSNGATWLWDGTKWVASTQPGGGGGNTQISVSDTPPAAPAHGALWWDSVGGQLYIYYADPDSSEWVQANTLAGLGAFLSLAGGTMTGPITLAGDPNAALQASTKQYVDTNVGHNVGRNLLHNGLFNVAQRGAGPWNTAPTYTFDRWQMSFGLDAMSVQPAALGVSGVAGDEEAATAAWIVVTGNSGATAYSLFLQNIENVKRLSGKTVTISFTGYVTSGTARIGVGLRQQFGTGGSPSATVDVNATAVTLTTTLSRYSVTLAVPSISGKTLGTNNDHSTRLGFFLSAGANNNTVAGGIGVQSNTFALWGVQLEIGSVASPLEKLDPRMDLANCQRFYQVLNAFLAGYALANVQIGYFVPFYTSMRAPPTITIATPGLNNLQNFAAGQITYAGFVPNGQAIATGVCGFNSVFTASADL